MMYGHIERALQHPAVGAWAAKAIKDMMHYAESKAEFKESNFYEQIVELSSGDS